MCCFDYFFWPTNIHGPCIWKLNIHGLNYDIKFCKRDFNLSIASSCTSICTDKTLDKTPEIEKYLKNLKKLKNIVKIPIQPSY